MCGLKRQSWRGLQCVDSLELRNTVENKSCMHLGSKSHKAGRPLRGSSIPEAKAETAAAASLLETLDKRTPSRIPTGVADAKNPITVQYFRMLACTAESLASSLKAVFQTCSQHIFWTHCLLTDRWGRLIHDVSHCCAVDISGSAGAMRLVWITHL